jgi:hypothetical protein
LIEGKANRSLFQDVFVRQKKGFVGAAGLFAAGPDEETQVHARRFSLIQAG